MSSSGMREKYQSLALTDLKEIAKSRGIKGTSSMKKADVIEAMLALDEKESQNAVPAVQEETYQKYDIVADRQQMNQQLTNSPEVDRLASQI